MISTLTGAVASERTPSRSQRATSGSDQPWVTAETSTTKNTTLKMSVPVSIPAMSGKVARVMGTAPLSPTQERKRVSRRLKPKGQVDRATASGRATKVRARATSRPSTATPASRLGKLSMPSMTNSTICPSQAAASWNWKMPLR